MTRRELALPGGRPFDLCVVGGGAYGACAAREAATRGLSVCLLERGDFGGATSSNSLRIVHGGLRYLQHGDLRRTRDSIRERRALLDTAPHLVRTLPFAVPVYGHGPRGREGYAVGLALADLVGAGLNGAPDPRRRFPRSRVVSREEMLRLCPGVREEGLTGGAVWHDGQVLSTERLLLAILASATRAGARLANHVEVTGVVREGRRVAGVLALDRLSGRQVEVSARLVLNASGPWADSVLDRLGVTRREPAFLPSKALNLLTRQVLPDRAVGVSGPAKFRDGEAWVSRGSRLLFLVPWRGFSLIGTRHLPWEGEPGEFSVTAEDVRLLLDEINAAYPAAALSAGDVVSVFGGMLPRASGSRPSAEVQLLKHSRVIDHGREDGAPGVLSMVGTKWTTARATAEEAVSLAAARLGRPAAPSRTAATPVTGGELGGFEDLLHRVRQGRPATVSDRSMLHLLRTYGSGYVRVLRHAIEDPSLGEPVHEGSPVIRAEVVHGVRDEMAWRLGDVVLRRTELALGGHPGPDALQACARLMAAELGWDDARTGRELDSAEAELRARLPIAAPSPAVPAHVAAIDRPLTNGDRGPDGSRSSGGQPTVQRRWST